jgi:hypothetical protein
MFTETYIEMVINNPDIQSLCKYNKGDWFWNGEKPYLYCKSGLGSSNPHDYKWLPTLEDLFGMIGDYRKQIDKPFLSILVMKKYKYKSMHELLLAIVMEILYNKSWNPKTKEWEESNGS